MLLYLNCFCRYNKHMCSCRELPGIHVSATEGGIDVVKKLLVAGVQVNIRGLFVKHPCLCPLCSMSQLDIVVEVL